MNQFVWMDFLMFGLLLVTAGTFVFLQFLGANEDALPGDESVLDTNRRSWFYPKVLIRQSGLTFERVWLLYWACKIFSIVTGLALLTEFGGPGLSVYIYLFTVLGCFFACDAWLMWKRRERRLEIGLSLEFFVNLMVVFLNSGFNLSQSFERSAQFGLDKSSPLGTELKQLSREMNVGRDRKLAFRQLSERTGVDGLRSLAAVVEAGIGIGTPMIEVLRSQLDLLRMKQQQEDSARLNRKALAILFPMAMVCFPMFAVLVYFPAALQVFELFGLLGEIL